jgi:hypothetical protein
MLIGYEYKTDTLYLHPGFAYNMYKYDDGVGIFDNDIVSYILYMQGKVDFGAVALKFTGHYGQNLGNYGISCRSNRYDTFDASSAYANGDEVDDSVGWGGYITAAIPIDVYTLNLGWGYSLSENDTAAMPLNDNPDELMGAFVNFRIPIADNFTATPEFDYYDGMDNSMGTEDPDHWALGVTFQTDF